MTDEEAERKEMVTRESFRTAALDWKSYMLVWALGFDSLISGTPECLIIFVRESNRS